MHANLSIIRHTNPRVLFAAFCLSCIGYYTGRLSTFSEWPTYDGRLEWKLAEAERVTITVQAPQVTVQGPQVTVHAPQATVTVVPKAPEVAVLNGPPTDTFQGMRSPPTLFEKTVELSSDNLLPDLQYITTWPGAGFSESLAHSAADF
jgi:hypothetical protein